MTSGRIDSYKPELIFTRPSGIMLISPICATRSNEFVRKAMQIRGHKKGCELVVLYLELVGIFGDGADDGVVLRVDEGGMCAGTGKQMHKWA